MNNPIAPTPLQKTLERYKSALNCLTSLNSSPNKDQVIEIFSARDALGKILETEAVIDTDILSELIELDSEFKKQAYKITKVDLVKFQNSLPSTSHVWLLDIENANKSHPWKRFEWGLQGAKILIWTVNVALFSTLATRFLSGGSGFLEVALIAFPGVLSLLQVYRELTQRERKCFYQLLKIFKGFPNISQLPKVVAIFFATLLSAIFSIYGLFLLFFLSIWFNQSVISDIYKNIGKTKQGERNLVLAEQNYLRAIAFDSDNFDAHFKLATLYNELEEVDKAKKEYAIAIKGKHLPAYNNLAYWYIRQDKFLDAIALLDRSRNLVKEQEKTQNLEQLTPKEKLDFKALKYNLAKNRGWAHLEARHDKDAEIYLRAAIKFLERNPEVEPYVYSPGAAHCLYAKFLEKQVPSSTEINQIKEQWQKCQELIQKYKQQQPINAEKYQWLYEAQQKSAAKD